VAPETQAGERYATQVGELWTGLSQTLVRLEALAGTPELLDHDEALAALRRLQYRLHIASESVHGLSPPAAAAPAHTELASALAGARDATGDVVEVVDLTGASGVETMIHEWRGALFRVRLARLRLSGQAGQPSRSPKSDDAEEIPKLHAPLVASGLTVAGAAAFAVGATAGPWPLWVAGMLAVCMSLLLYRP
jgi:hypothetical protein